MKKIEYIKKSLFRAKKNKKTTEYRILRKMFVIPFAMIFSLLFSTSVQATEKENFEGGNKYETRFVLTCRAELSDWQYYLYENPEAEDLYNAFSEITNEDGERVYSDEFIIGLLANITYEGTPGLVENAFALYHQYDFELPSGKRSIQNEEDIEYLLNWTTSNEDSVEGYAKKGSCGVSSLQWSYDRRITWLNFLKERIQEEGKTTVNKYDCFCTNIEMFQYELDENYKDGKYISLINIAADKRGNTPEAYAEAICDYYVCPGEADLCMKGTGSACIGRREEATRLWNLFVSTNKETYTISMDTE